MFYYDHRMVATSPPPPYYYPPSPYNPPGFDLYPGYFPKYYNALMMEPSSKPDLMTRMPPSPNSIQSDSDNSLSSVEVTTDHPHPSPPPPAATSARCRWRSCGLAFATLDRLAAHVSAAHAAAGPDGLFRCGWDACARRDRGFNARYKMLVHVRTHTNEKPHRCPRCPKSFSRAENLKIHARSHTGEKPYACHVPGCAKAYSNSSDRFKHARTHQVDKPYQCKVPGCPKRYTDPSSLRKHVKTYRHSISTSRERLQGDDVSIAGGDGGRVGSGPVREVPGRDEVFCDYDCCRPIRVGALIDLRKDEGGYCWNRFIETDFGPKRNGYDFGCHNNEQMDVDMPLDLSISRN